MRRRNELESDSFKVPNCRRARSSRNAASPSQIVKRLTSSGLIVKPVNIKDADQKRHTCRVCLKNGDTPIYGDRHFANVSEELSSFGGIEVRPEDAYPKHLCQSCRGLLEGAVSFRETAQQSEKVLRQPIKQERETSPVADLNDTENESGIIPDWDDKSILNKHTKYETNFKANDDLNVVGKRIMNFEYEVCVRIERETGETYTKPLKNLSEDTASKLAMTNKSEQVGDKDSSINKSHNPIYIANKTNKLDDGRMFVGTRIINSSYQLIEDKYSDMPNTLISDTGAWKFDIEEDIGKEIVGKRILNSEFTMLEEEIGDEGNMYRCKDCGLDFDTKKLFKEHKQSDKHRKRKVPCPVCKQMYSARSVRNHVVIHREAKFTCDICGKNFTTYTNFHNHHLVHTIVEKKFKCEQCDYRCRFKEYLRIHRRTHSERPYHCPHCPHRSFINTGNLNRHMLTNHKLERDFKCEPCDRGFYTKRELDVHIDAIHRGHTHACTYCGKVYSYVRSLRRHELIAHKREKRHDSAMKRQGEEVLLSNME